MAAMLRILRININLALRAHINMLSMTLMHHLALSQVIKLHLRSQMHQRVKQAHLNQWYLGFRAYL